MFIIGERGRRSADKIAVQGIRMIVVFVFWKCHLVFILFFEGNRVSVVEYINRM